MAETQGATTAGNGLTLRQELNGLLNDLRQRIRLYVLIDGVARVLVAVGLCFWASLAIDYLFELPRFLRFTLLVGIACGLCYLLLVQVIGRLVRGLRDKALALVLERRFPILNDRLVTSVELAGRGDMTSPLTRSLLQRTIDDVSTVVQQLDLREVFDQRPQRRSVTGSVALLVSIIAFGFAYGDVARQWASRNLLLADEIYARQTAFEVMVVAEPGERVIPLVPGRPYKHPRGSDLVLRAEVPAGFVVPDEVQFRHRMRTSGSGRRDYMARQGDRRFQATLAGLTDAIEFWVRGGDAAGSTPYLIEAVDPPRLDRVTLRCLFPDYTGKNLRDEETGQPVRTDVPVQGTQVRIPLGTEFLLEAVTNKPLRSAIIEWEQTQWRLTRAGLTVHVGQSPVGVAVASETPLFSKDGRTIRLPCRVGGATDAASATKDAAANDGTEKPAVGAPAADAQPGSSSGQPNTSLPLRLPAEAALKITLTDEDDIVSPEPIRLVVLSDADRPPEVDVRLKGVGSMITRQARLPVSGTLRDDFGVAEARFEYLLDEADSVIARPFVAKAAGRLEVDVAEKFEVLPLDLKLGQRLAVLVAAKDGDVLTGPHETRSDRFLFTIVSNEELLAILATKELGLRPRFEQIVEEIRGGRKDLLIQRAKLDEARQLRSGNPADKGRQVTEAERSQLAEIDEAAETAVERINSGLLKNENELASVEQAFRDLRDEIDNNSLPDLERLLERMDRGIIGPLGDVRERDLKNVRDGLAVLRLAVQDRLDQLPATDNCLELLEIAIGRLETILAQMSKQESVNEALQLLRDIIKQEKELRERTEKERKKSLLE